MFLCAPFQFCIPSFKETVLCQVYTPYVCPVSWSMMDRRVDSKIYPFSLSMQYQFAHITFYSSLKFVTIFMYTLWMTDNSTAFLFGTITITAPCYAITLFQSCQNFFLYHRLHFFLILTTRKLSRSK